MQTEVIVVAAGSGTRMGSAMKKQYLPLDGAPILVRTLQTLAACPTVHRIVLVVAAEDVPYISELIEAYHLSKIGDVVAGGRERQDSVRNGIGALLHNTEIAAVHDAARPLVTPEEVEAVLTAAKMFGAATLGVPVKDTIKRVDQGQVRETLQRSDLWAVHTPQAFRCEWLAEAHMRAWEQDYTGTDDASLVEWAGYPVSMVEGLYSNLKVTTPEDLVIAEALWRARKGTDNQ
ncbi:2-C-methyl-D-erythritol 4-phosphate cytidylyltransferase [Tumebacillus sp. ITR2]|uniref:2-C-methyl-D-erythritol 4-phosphate cytidylyltransferase n=1 Tax=Tumebacillus amylolyticus TaxID=2801339 RepID=A0ABS1JGL2_9BACL|nr:2-C-methyl-D-erythritol 4-phosphate cytidylyltransferase [Tumebacillus amylolyticus]MBL0389432.1 2-C-methyl-D-erythritol 4-phosphate cytidylyltransferase [Tumebacillus amylolyticus]